MARSPTFTFTRLPDDKIAVSVLGTATGAIIQATPQQFAEAIAKVAKGRQTKKRVADIKRLIEDE